MLNSKNDFSFMLYLLSNVIIILFFYEDSIRVILDFAIKS